MALKFVTEDGELTVPLSHLVVAGWTARDVASVDHHIRELSVLGVSPPSSVPLFYRVSASLAEQTESLDVLGGNTSGEVEPLLVHHDGELWLGLASDHTDRELESHSVVHSKQVCGKPLCNTLWRYADLAERLDDLILESWIDESGTWSLYQEGTFASIRPVSSLIADSGLKGFPGGAAMLCGTLSAIGGVRPADGFRAQLSDPLTGRTIDLEYRVNALPVVA